MVVVAVIVVADDGDEVGADFKKKSFTGDGGNKLMNVVVRLK